MDGGHLWHDTHGWEQPHCPTQLLCSSRFDVDDKARMEPDLGSLFSTLLPHARRVEELSKRSGAPNWPADAAWRDPLFAAGGTAPTSVLQWSKGTIHTSA